MKLFVSFKVVVVGGIVVKCKKSKLMELLWLTYYNSNAYDDHKGFSLSPTEEICFLC